MIYYCTFCGVPLTPGLRMCPCGQVFGHPVPDFDAQGEPGARYWPPRQPSSAEAAMHRAAAWWEGISNRNKAIGGGALGVMLIVVVGAGAHYGSPQPYQNPPTAPQVPASMASSAAPVERPQAYMPPIPAYVPPAPTVVIHPWYNPAAADINTAAGGPEFGQATTDWVGVANTDEFDWMNIEIVINPGGGDYTLHTSVIHPSTGKNSDGTPYAQDFNYGQFADPAGNRFQPGMKINRIQLTCDTPSGRATHMMTFND